MNFWSMVAKSDGCWVWTGTRWSTGYGRLVGGRAAHRVAWELTNGPIPRGLLVCHHCDNPPCCRPDHLFLGTSKDNAMDASAKGRLLTGKSHPANTQREKWMAAGAKRRGIPPHPVTQRMRELTSKRFKGRPKSQDQRARIGAGNEGERNGNARLTASQALEIYGRCSRGDSRALIAKSFGVSLSLVRMIANRQKWKSIHKVPA